MIDLSIEYLFRKHYSRLCHFAWQILSDNELIEDIVQDAFMGYWNNKHTIANNDIAIKNFLYTSVRHACYNIIRREKVEQRYHLLNQTETVEELQTIAKIIRAEVMDEIYKIIQTMPNGCQSIFRLGYLEGLTNPQIAEQLNISINTVKTQKQRGLKIIKSKLSPELFSLLTLVFIEG
ncbi:RNA polymerase sigma-70 factor [Albibacterium bauzanense]|uniref:RNA polymerase sigma-70 factor (ECF subfamily) n=1 Tax=Albibacterium bauzanense TaxID=653929 RepID=A0A4R1LNH5_9SPHI|nr:RNA polymerase sigma-70 factor [Albibacterium bauzanense]TCK80588.1 RNA polymerase sigma-70 factor (ECF subfamily) [Albibacterium bauzanense]